MFGFMVTADGGLTTAGYVITVIAGIILFFLAAFEKLPVSHTFKKISYLSLISFIYDPYFLSVFIHYFF